LEAQAQQSQSQQHLASPLISNVAASGGGANTLSDRQRKFLKQKQQQQSQQQKQQHESQSQGGTASTGASPGRESVTTTASQNRINRIRNQHHQGNDNDSDNYNCGSPPGAVNNSNTNNGHSHIQATNLMEKRKQHQQRRMVAKQNQQQHQNQQHNELLHQSAVDSVVERAGGVPMVHAAAAPAGVTAAGASHQQSAHVPNNDGSSSNNNNNRLSKMHRMQKRKGYDHVKARQHSKLGGAVSAADAAAAAAARTAADREAKGRQGQSADGIATTATMSPSPSSPFTRQRQRHNMQNATTSPHLPTVSSAGSSSFSPTGTMSPPQMGLDTSLENTVTSAATDDDATLTSVRRVMGGGGGHDNASSSRYEHLQTHLGPQQHSGRPSTASTVIMNHHHHRHHNHQGKNGHGASSSETSRGWTDEEKSDKDTAASGTFLHSATSTNSRLGRGARGASGIGNGVDRLLRTASSSDYDTDGDISKASRRSQQSATNLHRLLLDGGPSHSQVTDVNDFFTNPASKYGGIGSNNLKAQQQEGLGSTLTSSGVNPYYSDSSYNRQHHPSHGQGGRYHADDDDRTFDYGDRDDDNNDGADADDDSNASESYAARRRRKEEAAAADLRRRGAGDASLGSGHHHTGRQRGGGAGNSSLGSPGKKRSPEIGDENDNNILNAEDIEKYSKAMDNPAVKLGAGVVGVATVGCIAFGPVGLLVGVAAVGLGFGVMQIPEEERNKIQEKAEAGFHKLQEKACDASETLSSSCLTTYKHSGVAEHIPHCYSGTDVLNNKDFDTARSENFRNGNFDEKNIGGAFGAVNHQAVQDDILPPNNGQAAAGPSITVPSIAPPNERMRNKKVACLRNVRILPVSQIYSLDPATQPRAWIDIVASANTTDAEKNEAMEEILLLAKDKRRAKIFLDEGILDSVIWSLSRYLEKLDTDALSIDWANPNITPQEKTAANLAAQVCVTLGKAHCAAIHTEGDLMLMSQYERGTVPEERQVAQMLHEVPHHVRATKTKDPTIVIPSKEVFALRQLTLPQAEELAKSVMAVAEGRM
jgi:hypothetical protein